MERLTEDYNDSYCLKKCHPNNDCFCDGRGCPIDNCGVVIEALNKLGEYEKAEEQGLLVRLPFKRGTVLYRIKKGARKPIIKMVASQITVNGGAYSVKAIEEDYGEVFFSDDVIGIKVFATREEAEKKLEEMNNND